MRMPFSIGLIIGRLFFAARMAFYAFMLFRIYQLNHDPIKGVTASDKRFLTIFFLVFLAVIELIVQGIRYAIVANRRNAQRRMQEAAEAQARAIANQKAWETENMPALAAGSLLLQPGEQCVLNQHAAIYGPVTQTRNTGGFGGVSVPIGHTGIRARVGQFGSHPVTTTHMALINDGPMYLTNTRIVVLGELQMSQLPLHDILTLDEHSDGVKVSIANGKPLTIKTGSPQFGIYLRRLLQQNASHAGI